MIESSSLIPLQQQFTGKRIQPYPPFSSIRVKGKALFWWALNGRLSEIEIPTTEIEIKQLRLIESINLSSSTLHQMITQRINSLDPTCKGKFREAEILDRWHQILVDTPHVKDLSFLVASFEASVTSGTYIRTLAHQMGEALGVGAIAMDIKRTKLDQFDLDCVYKID